MGCEVLLVACGLKREARAARGPGIAALAGGGRAEALSRALERALDRGGVRGVISFGLGGALNPALKVGDVVVASGVVAPSGRIGVDQEWAGILADRLNAAFLPVAGSDAMLLTRAARQDLARRSGAALVDMESHRAAACARRAGLPFAALRIVSDLASRDLPAAVTQGMRPDGGMDMAAVLKAVARDPAQIGALLRTAADAERAFRVLFRCGRLLGPGLGFPNFRQLVLDMA